MRVVVTGAGGFIGGHLVKALARRGDDVHAWVHRAPGGGSLEAATVVACDITDPDAVATNLARAVPHLIVHLAAQSLPGVSWEDPAGTYRTNVVGTICLLEAIRKLSDKPRVLLAGSSAEYAEPEDSRLIEEVDPREPNSPYGASKLAADQIAGLYIRRYGLDLVRFRPFLFVGPGKVGDVCSDFARRLVAIERGQEEAMRVGRLDVLRDLTDIRDGIAAILCLAAAGHGGEAYNVCSGRAVSIAEILAAYRSLAKVRIETVEDPTLIRPLEQRTKIGSPAKLATLGWRPAHRLNDTLGTILDYWRGKP